MNKLKWDMKLGIISDSLYLRSELGDYKFNIFGFYRYQDIDCKTPNETVMSMQVITKNKDTGRNKMIVAKYFYYDVNKPMFKAIRDFVNSDDFHNTIKESEEYYNIEIL